MPNMKEKSVKVRLIRKQLELAQRKIANMKNKTGFNTYPAEQYDEGLIEGIEGEVETLTHLLENCTE